MKKIYLIFIACLVVFISSFSVSAQKSGSYENNTWYFDKQTVLDLAIAQKKQILICYGVMTCYNTETVRTLLGKGSLKDIVDSTFILWYADSDITSRYSSDLNEYMGYEVFPTLSYTLPLLAVVNTYDLHKSRGVSQGAKTEEQLKNYLLQYVANDKVATVKPDTKIYLSDQKLVIDNNIDNETVNVYSITGSLVDKFDKTGQSITRNASSYPSGIFIVSGSSGWTKKIINKK